MIESAGGERQAQRMQTAREMLADRIARALPADGTVEPQPGVRFRPHSASHFSREYKRHFGEPPMRDVETLRGAAAER